MATTSKQFYFDNYNRPGVIATNEDNSNVYVTIEPPYQDTGTSIVSVRFE